MDETEKARRERLPAPGWPWWIAFGLLTPALIVLAMVVRADTAAAVALGGESAMAGRDAVVSARRVDETTHSVPWAKATYRLTLPASAPAALAGSTHEYTTPYRQLFGGDPFPATADFRVVYGSGGGYTLTGPAPARSLRVITASGAGRRPARVDRAAAGRGGVHLTQELGESSAPSAQPSLTTASHRIASAVALMP